MIIRRTINKTQIGIELTADELHEAYKEQQHKYDVSAIENYGQMIEPEYMLEEIGCTYEEFESMKEDMAYEMRKLIDKDDYNWDYARSEAVDNIIKERKGVTA